MPNRVKTLQKLKFYLLRAHNSFNPPLKLNFYFLQSTTHFYGQQCLICHNDLFTLYFTNMPNLYTLNLQQLNLASLTKRPFNTPFF